MPRVAASSTRIWANMSPPTELHTSMDRLGRQPWRSSAMVNKVAVTHVQLDLGAPSEAAPPLSAISFSSSSAKVLQCT